MVVTNEVAFTHSEKNYGTLPISEEEHECERCCSKPRPGHASWLEV